MGRAGPLRPVGRVRGSGPSSSAIGRFSTPKRLGLRGFPFTRAGSPCRTNGQVLARVSGDKSDRKAALSMRGTRQKSAVLLDKHPLWLDALDKLVERQGIDVVGRATSGDEAVSMIEEHRPDVFIAGVDARGGEDLAVVKSATRANPGMRAVVVGDD